VAGFGDDAHAMRTMDVAPSPSSHQPR
jgi:hypothetical protein